MEERPILNQSISKKDFIDFYWLKSELVTFCKDNQIPTSGGKKDLEQRIIHFLEYGKPPKTVKKQKPTSTFDWNSNTLSLETIITDNYKNTEQVRTFFKAQIGSQFAFNVAFMDWMKSNSGKTLEEAIEAWHSIKTRKKTTKSEIAPQFEYNTFIRDFMEDNPEKSFQEARNLWNYIRSKRGKKKYDRTQLKYLM